MNTPNMQESMQQMEKVTQSLMHVCEEMGSIARNQMDAGVRSATACMQGATEISQNVNGLVQESMSRAVNAGRTMMTAKSLREMMDLQNEFMKEAFESWVTSSGKISEISARVTKDTIDPLAEHATTAMNKLAERAKQAA